MVEIGTSGYSYISTSLQDNALFYSVLSRSMKIRPEGGLSDSINNTVLINEI
jgi:hypothetical protein